MHDHYVVLIALTEDLIPGRSFAPKKQAKFMNTAHFIDIIIPPLNALKEKVRLDIGPEDFVNPNEKLIMGYVHR